MITAEAIQKLQETKAAEAQHVNAQIALIPSMVGRFVALPDGITVADYEKHLPHRARMRGDMKTEVIDSFVAFVNDSVDEADSECFVNPDGMKAVAILNMGNEGQPGHCDFQAVLSLKKTVEYVTLLHIHGASTNSQKTIAEWIEDYYESIVARDDDGDIDIKKAIAAIREINLVKHREQVSDVQKLSTTASVLETQSASSPHRAPTEIFFTCIPYVGLMPRTFALRLSVIEAGDKLALSLKIRLLEKTVQDMAIEFADIIDNQIECPVYVGTFDPGK